MSYEDLLKNYNEETTQKIEYYVKLFVENGVNETTLTEFLADNSFSTFGGNGWACPICSHGCFKINVMWALESLEKKNKLNFTLDDFQSLEMELSCNHIQENKE